jgi:hypothetical protein
MLACIRHCFPFFSFASSIAAKLLWQQICIPKGLGKEFQKRVCRRIYTAAHEWLRGSNRFQSLSDFCVAGT